jgi:hypothetical protein
MAAASSIQDHSSTSNPTTSNLVNSNPGGLGLQKLKANWLKSTPPAGLNNSSADFPQLTSSINALNLAPTSSVNFSAHALNHKPLINHQSLSTSNHSIQPTSSTQAHIIQAVMIWLGTLF